jgi:ubiquinone/menaquinone biosynthesis C-methylase UbiE
MSLLHCRHQQFARMGPLRNACPKGVAIMTAEQRSYLPAAGRDWLLPFYDPLSRLLGGDAIRREFLERADLRSGMRVLDIGCGTGSLAVLIKRLHPNVEVVGLDPDPNALARAQRKAERAGVPIQLDQGFSDKLPYPNASFDRVLSTLMFHHVPRAEREPTLREVARVLKPGGALYLMDLTGSHPHAGVLVRIFHPGHRPAEGTADRMVTLMQQAGLRDAQKIGQRMMWLWPVATYRASASA